MRKFLTWAYCGPIHVARPGADRRSAPGYATAKENDERAAQPSSSQPGHSEERKYVATALIRSQSLSIGRRLDRFWLDDTMEEKTKGRLFE